MVRGPWPSARQQPLERGEHEGRGFARSRFRARDQVVPGQRERYDRALNRPGLLEPQVSHAFEKPAVQVERGERQRRRVAGRRLQRRCVAVSGSSGRWRLVGAPWMPARRSVWTSVRVIAVGCIRVQFVLLARPEGDDAPHGIVRRYANGDAIARNNFNAEAAHAAAELGKDFMTGVALDPVEAAAVNGDDGALHIDEIILAQTLAFLSWCRVLTSLLQMAKTNIVPQSARIP